MTLKLNQATRNDAQKWNAFLIEHAKGQDQPCNHAYFYEWAEIFSAVFGHRPIYLFTEVQGRVTGILPLYLVSSALFGRALISMPYLNAGGPIAEDPESLQLLLDETRKLAQQESVRYVELRATTQLDFPETGLPAQAPHLRSHKVSMRLPLVEDAELVFSNFPAKLRSQIRKPSKAGFVAERFPATSPLAQEKFFHVFSRNMRDLGTPTYPRKLFNQTARHFGERITLTIVSQNNNPAAVAATIAGYKTVEVLWASSLRIFNNQSPNMLLYWDMIKQAVEAGYTEFDFGRSSRDSGTYRFKEQWGAQAYPLFWYYLGDAEMIPDINPKNSKFARLVEIWKRLPLPIANFVGPRITKSLP